MLNNKSIRENFNRESHERFYRYDNLKFFLMVFVVIGHAIADYVPESHLMTSAWIFISTFHMPVFIFLFGLFSKRVINSSSYPGEKIYTYIFLYIAYKILIYWTKLFADAHPDLNYCPKMRSRGLCFHVLLFCWLHI